MENIKPGLYIHIPFCLSKCTYCSFYSIESIKLIPAYLAALEQEIKFYSRCFSSFGSIYIGGGTPSLLNPEQIAGIFSAIYKAYKVDADAEITIEVNPGDISLDYLNALYALGINRLNIGIQSFSARTLKFLGRRHSAGEAVYAIESARQAGFDNLGIDLIYGVHGSGIKSWVNTLQKALGLAPEHISCYQLSLDKKTPLYKKYSAERWKLPDEDTGLRFFFTTSELLEEAGYLHYEVSNFARNDALKSKHNMKYWQHAPYLGLGAAAHSFLNNRRWWNKPAIQNYLSDIAADKMPVENTENLSAEQLRLEALFLGLRTKAGIDLQYYKAKYGFDLLVEKRTIIDALIRNKLLELQNGFLRPTTAGMAVADSLALI